MKLSIVTTMYCSEPYLMDFYRRISESADFITKSYEIIFVNDGSPDSSLKTALDLQKKDKKIKIIDLSRNFGHHKALITGLSHARGDYVFLIDSDLEEEPELLPVFWKRMKEAGDIDVIYGRQKKRKGGLIERATGWLFYRLFNLFSENKIPENLVVARLMKKKYVKDLILHREYHPVLAGLFELTGYTQEAFVIEKKNKGKTTYNLRRKLNMIVNSITSFSAKPLVYIFYLGLLISSVTFIFIIRILYQKLFLNIAVGWASIVVSVWFFGGLIIFCIGIIGIYLSRVFEQTKGRPYVIIKDIYGDE